MNREEIKVCVMRVGGTNCDAETQRAFQELGVQAETVHVNELIKRRNLLDYQCSGFSRRLLVRRLCAFRRDFCTASLSETGQRNGDIHRRRQTNLGHMQRLPNPRRIRFASRLQRHERLPRSHIDDQ